ncbi:predicted protein [Histoplasma capsulatum var. duboisii H88]|uniref:Predicted protein n=1 Tax=Ajellomyces capsulatus (strain H88) TaxID=544711 RepID=F0U9I2_AJEC8|nr:predicted protein [Histoplasma capsulatum var. duboisii H88]
MLRVPGLDAKHKLHICFVPYEHSPESIRNNHRSLRSSRSIWALFREAITRFCLDLEGRGWTGSGQCCRQSIPKHRRDSALFARCIQNRPNIANTTKIPQLENYMNCILLSLFLPVKQQMVCTKLATAISCGAESKLACGLGEEFTSGRWRQPESDIDSVHRNNRPPSFTSPHLVASPRLDHLSSTGSSISSIPPHLPIITSHPLSPPPFSCSLPPTSNLSPLTRPVAKLPPSTHPPHRLDSRSLLIFPPSTLHPPPLSNPLRC